MKRYGEDPIKYPLSGLKYVMSHPSLWRSVFCVVLLGITVALVSFILLLVFALKPQAEAFGGYQWWSWLLAVLAVIFEALLVTALLLKVAQSKSQKTLFVETMRQEGKWKPDMVEPSMINDLNCCKVSFFVRLITFPINLIPVAGTVIYAFINAPYAGWDYMDMYLDAIQMDSKAQRIEVLGENNSIVTPSIYLSMNGYMRFGFACVLLETLPVAGPALFALTNACGAALWACDMEASGGPPSIRSNSKTASLAGNYDSTV